jgi:excisionase family DNA binding protein
MSDLSPFFLSLCESQEFKEVLKSTIIQALNEREVPPEPTPIFHTKKEAAKYLRISLPTLDSYIRMGFLEASRIGDRVLISQEAINKALKAMPTWKYKQKRA